MSPSRRALLRNGLGLAAMATAAGLSACSGGQGDQGVGASSQGPVKISASQVPVGGGAALPGRGYVVTQPTKGSYKAFSSVCPHAGCNVSAVRDGQIICPCHDSHFKITDGSVTQGPATKGLTPATVAVQGSTLRISA